MPRRAWLTRFIEFLPTNYSQVCQERSGRARFARAHTVWVIWNKVNPVKLIQNIRAKTRACHMRFGTQAWQGVNIPKIWNPIVSDRIENHASVKVSNYRECQITSPHPVWPVQRKFSQNGISYTGGRVQQTSLQPRGGVIWHPLISCVLRLIQVWGTFLHFKYFFRF